MTTASDAIDELLNDNASSCESCRKLRARVAHLEELIVSHADDRWEASDLMTRLLNVRADCDRLTLENHRLKRELAARGGAR